MKDQVTSIEQSKRLIEMGVPADKASMVWEWVSSAVDEINYELNIWQGCKLDKILAYQEFPESFIPAFTVADLLAVLPKTIWGDRKGWIHLIIRFPNEDHCKIVYDNSYNILWKCDGSLLSCIVETIDWVVTNGYRLNP